ncbi:hypothetical protein VNO78_06459 [Psophocarpus tetragonolobus]|uniref:Uncharacterized protein n=1 Tax=Psophocarpus tetragonolobus TaxID=3891 RepID=A0AAN9SS72_PSOTE
MTSQEISTLNTIMSTIDTLKVAAQEGDINRLYQVIEKDPQVLDDIDSKSFVETPLHVAAFHGHLYFATEIIILKPSLALKLDSQGLSPLHRALHRPNERMVLRLRWRHSSAFGNSYGKGKRALDIAGSDHAKRKLEERRDSKVILKAYIGKLRMKQYMSEEESNAYLIVVDFIKLTLGPITLTLSLI